MAREAIGTEEGEEQLLLLSLLKMKNNPKEAAQEFLFFFSLIRISNYKSCRKFF